MTIEELSKRLVEADAAIKQANSVEDLKPVLALIVSALRDEVAAKLAPFN